MEEISISSASLLPLSLLHLLSGEPLPCCFAAKCVEMIRVLERHLHNACVRRVIRESAAAARACSTSHRRALYVEVRLLITRAALYNVLFIVHTACPGYRGYYVNVTEHVIGAPRQSLCVLISKLVELPILCRSSSPATCKRTKQRPVAEKNLV